MGVLFLVFVFMAIQAFGEYLYDDVIDVGQLYYCLTLILVFSGVLLYAGV